MSTKTEKTAALLDALRPFVLAAAVGWSVEDEVNKAAPNQHTSRPLLGFGGYAGQYAAQSRVSWADWKQLLDAATELWPMGLEGETTNVD